VRAALKDYSERLPAPFDLADIEGRVKEKSPYVVVALQEVRRAPAPRSQRPIFLRPAPQMAASCPMGLRVERPACLATPEVLPTMCLSLNPLPLPPPRRRRA
jgi:hypothetical protein